MTCPDCRVSDTGCTPLCAESKNGLSVEEMNKWVDRIVCVFEWNFKDYEMNEEKAQLRKILRELYNQIKGVR